MKTQKELKIAVLDDSSFYNKLLTKQIENCTTNLAYTKGYNCSINSFVHFDDFLRNLRKDTDLVFIDYFLGQGVTGGQIIKQIKKICKNCKVIVVSKVRSIQTVVDTVSEGATAFIYKDKNALARACFFVEHIAEKKH